MAEDRDKQSIGSSRSLTSGPNSMTVTYQNNNTTGWFDPLKPLPPMAPEEIKGRVLDFPTGYNRSIRPRAYEAITFEQLRSFADSYDLLRLVIETRKDQVAALRWNIVVREHAKDKANDEAVLNRIEEIKKFFVRPDKENFWDDWLRMILEDLFVLDAPSVYRRKTYGGDIFALEPIDGGTIKRVVDQWGRTPPPPETAYQQVLKGFPAIDYTTEDLMYRPRNKRTHKVYGYSPVEQIVMTINIGLRRQVWQLQSFTEGNIPEALIGTPSTWTPDQIRSFQDWFDAMLEGNTAQRSKARFVPGEVSKGFVSTKPSELFGGAEEWLARVVCYAFSVSPQAFVQIMNRATAETAQETAQMEGLAPVMKWVKGFMDAVLIDDFQEEDLEFAWVEEDELDPGAKSEIIEREQASGRLTMNEARKEQGRDPIDHPDADRPMIKTASGWVPIFKTPEEESEAERMRQQIAGEAPVPGEEGEEKPGEVSEEEGGSPTPPTPPGQGDEDAPKMDKADQGDMSSYFPVQTEHRDKVWATGGNTKEATAERSEALLMSVPFDQCVATQDYCDHEKVKLYTQDPTAIGFAPMAYFDGSSYYLQDGHHRAVASKASGSTSMVMSVKNIEPDFKKLDFAHRDALRKSEGVLYIDPERAKALKIQRRVATLFASAFRKSGKKISKEAVSALSDLGKADKPEDEIDIDEILNLLEVKFISDIGEDLAEDLADLYSDSMTEALAQIGTPLTSELVNAVNERSVEWAEDYAAELVGLGDGEFSVPQSTRDMLRITISKSIADNLSAEDIGAEIAKSYAFSEERAEVIAMTEIASANSNGALEGYLEAEREGVKLKKSWLRLGDACPVCVGNADAGKIPLEEAFPSGDMAPPAHPHCRCVLVPEVEEDDVEKVDGDLGEGDTPKITKTEFIFDEDGAITGFTKTEG